MNWLFLKGLARGMVHWDRQPAAFQAALPDAQLFFLDLPGVGEAVERPGPASVAAIMEDLRGRWLELRAANEGPWGILAISLGGMLAIEWMARYPDDFERGVVLVASAANLSPTWKRLLTSSMPGYLRALVTRDFEKRERLVLGTITNDADHLEELVQQSVELATSCPLPPAVTSKQLLAASLWRAPKTLTVATLFLGTEGDRMVHPSCTLRLAAHFHAPVVMHPWAGHEIPLDDPDWVAARVREWLGELAP